MRICTDCNQEFPLSFFYGKGTDTYARQGRCKDCFNKMGLERLREKKRKAVAYKGGCCIQCGYDRCINALEFHHRDKSSKSRTWNSMRGWSWERLRSELDECDLLCANCHREVEFGCPSEESNLVLEV